MNHLLAKPEREPLQFELDVSAVPEDIYNARAAIKQAAEKLLFHWKTVPIALPPSIIDDQSICGDGYNSMDFKDLFVAPTFNEMDQIARDAKGNIRKLNRKQLACIQRAGEFEVESMNFPGQVHRWRLSQILQKGAYNTHESFLNDLSLSLKMLIIHAKDRFISPFFSLSESIKSLGSFLWQFFDILIGMAWTKVHNLSAKLLEEHSKFLVAELDIKPGSRQAWVAFCNFIKEKCRETKVKKHDIKLEDLHPPQCPYTFLTPSGIEIDMRLFGRDLFAISSKIVKKILEQESSGWYIKYKDEIIKELKGKNMSHVEIKEHVQNSIQERYYEKVFEALLSNDELEKIEPGLANLLVAQAKCAIFIERNLYNVKERFILSEEEFNTSLVKKYPVRSRIKQWMDRKLHQHGERFSEQHAWDAHHQSIDDCRVHGLEQMMYFIYRDLIFMRDREPVLKKELSKVKVPCREFTFVRQIWSPKSWIVKKCHQGETEIIPTVVSSTYFLASGHQHSLEHNDTTFDLEKTKKYKTNSSYAFWRVMNYFHRAVLWTMNVVFLLGIVVPWFSPVSLRTLFSPHPFMSSFMLNPLNGEICPDPSSKRSTLLSRLRKLWAHVKQSRHRFECEPETGFLGKSLSRHFNRFWNYVLKGFLGSVLMIIFLLPLCLVCSFSCLALAVASPVWVPVSVLALHLFDILVYDFDHPDDSNRWFYLFETVVYRLILHGMLQPAIALLLAFIALPTASVVILVGGILRRIVRTIWDTLMFHCIIKKRGRIPSQDGFIAKRIAGPGLASSYYYQVRPEQALAAVEARMEIHELDAWWESYSIILDQPKREYKKFVEHCFSPFSAVLSNEGVYQKLVRETEDHQKVLLKHVESRKQKLHTGLSVDTQSRIRLTSRELKVVVAQTSKMLEEFYPVRVLNRIQKSEDKFWEEKRLNFRDWQGLALQLLTEAFSPSVTMPLEEIDTCFKLNVEHLNLKRYLEMLKAAEFRDDLDIVSTIHSPKGDIDVGPPSMNIKIFNPNHDFVNHIHNKEQEIKSRRKWDKRNSFPEVLAFFERLLVPLPVAHPTTVAIVIHNRDENRQPILQDYVCQRILSAAEGLPHVLSALVTESHPNVATSSTLIRSNTEVQTESPHLVTQEDSISNSGNQDLSNETTSPTTDIQDYGDQATASAVSIKIDIPESPCCEDMLKPMPRHSKTMTREECSASESFSLMQACQYSGTL